MSWRGGWDCRPLDACHPFDFRTFALPALTIDLWPPPDLLPRPRLHRHPRPAAPIRWRPVEVPAPPELDQLAAIASELARSPLV